ncbi:biotin-dependent carboxyltransferase family protein [Aneurinibacillus terranovensis]|uniref:5-oxoprolinase subunit C family protein n=1 Tax=Aneurinibacillus terranovensis TaxID=278991 RepID=UPI0003F6BEFB|nr:biotin-dependent carboxyltransferase family protein [Aneurinibacillus terranovensis]
MLRIIEPGLETTVQDLGRYGSYHLGVPPSGAADKYSFMAGNILLGNPLDYAALEISLLGPTIEFQKSTVIAITGATVQPTINKQPIPMWENVRVQEGDILRFTFSKKGVKTYLCVSGGINVPEVLGSRSTYELSGYGGYQGRKLMAGDLLPVGEPLPGVFKQVGKRIPPSFIPDYSGSHEIRVVMGLSAALISDEGVKSFLNSEWHVSTESNRVAYRYQGASIGFRNVEVPFGAADSNSSVVDIAYPIGVIIVPNEEEVIILLNDGTSGGGFVTIGTVISPDLDLVAQSRPMSTSRFLAVTFDQAMEARLDRQKTLATLTDILK